mmetsp:Transcript_32216/g.79046  ORF Transcript_32216/g.79046 Transcript_32216/m.79046 type:complete len:221 (-) Transcript_32216:10-672(-)|eukprot:CAMPEP_0206272874 /NCGR_PEP_ID=MMETSP0047_2-20121206/34257_1 /ASSEMBLY_ACC=CAM_ASM_000192 /TAXON_ID=195065 /ORGANISM="Chroomonas mesostigmatica_cf, Strain CCMP1168" /LENGTH=220 /DNA_ID=CAMNT_0053701857 /DNA_START=155 /DNA_END=817 /DNA_ORIENTATION=+
MARTLLAAALLLLQLSSVQAFTQGYSCGGLALRDLGQQAAAMASRRPLGGRATRAQRSPPAGLRQARAITDMVFEPQAPPLGSIVSMIGIFSLAGYWWLVFVPSERRDLAANKNKGGLNGYLDKLNESPDGERKLEKWFYTEWLQRRRSQQTMLLAKAKSQSESSGESFEAVLARLHEEEIAANIERSKAMPSFLSADNPVLVAGALAVFGALVAAGGKH